MTTVSLADNTLVQAYNMSSPSAHAVVDLENPSSSSLDAASLRSKLARTSVHDTAAKSPTVRKSTSRYPLSPKTSTSSDRTNSTVATSGINSPSHEAVSRPLSAASPTSPSGIPGLAITTEELDMAALPAAMPRGAAPARLQQQWQPADDDRLMLGPPIEIAAGEGIYRFPTPRQSSMVSPQALHAHPLTGMEFGIRTEQGPSTQNIDRPQYSPRSKDRRRQSVLIGEKITRSNTNRELPIRAEGEAPKLSRWKSLGGLFGRRRGIQYQNGLPLRTNTSQILLADQNGASPKAASPRDPPRSGSISSQAQQTGPGIFRKMTRRAARPRNGSNLQRNKSSPGLSPKRSPVNLNKELPQEPSDTVPTLNVDIPEVRMDRYSVMFKEVNAKALPKRSSSLLARRQGAETEQPPKPLRLRALDTSGAPRKRRSTEPLPRLETLSNKVYQGSLESSADKPPHISTLHRPRPVQRKLSPDSDSYEPTKVASHASPPRLDDFVLVDRGSTPTPSSSKSPKTPTSVHGDFRDQDIPKNLPFQRNSWESNDSNRLEVPTEIITIGKRLSPGDLLSTTIGTVAPRRGNQIEALKAAEASQVAVARSMSLTRSNSQKVTVTRSASQRARPVTGQAKLIGNPQRPPRREFSPPAPEPTAVTPPLPDRSDLRKDLNREIWGGRSWDNLADQVKHTVLTPKIEEVGDGTRKSVWGVIEEA